MRSALAAVTSVLVLAASAAAATPERCAAAKQKAAVAKAKSIVKCQGKASAQGGGVDAACFAKADTKLFEAWARIEAAGGCATFDDATAIAALVDQFVLDLLAALPPTTTSTSSTSSTTITTTTSVSVTTTTTPGPCGNASLPCCSSGTACQSGYACSGGICVHCGLLGGPCCGPGPPACISAPMTVCRGGICMPSTLPE